MGLFESFRRDGHQPCFANRFVWGDPIPEENDFLQNPDGPGWHIDRSRFERSLRAAAVARGARMLIPARIAGAEADGGGWRLTLEDGSVVHGAFLIDAGGRTAPLASKLGARRRRHDRLICHWMLGASGPAGKGITYIEAVKDGWWYCAPLPGNRRVLAFHTDSDLPGARCPDLLAKAADAPELASLLADARFVADGDALATAANSAALEPFVGTAWLAVGDAALAFDPLSSQGLLNALFTGRAAAEAADRHLSGSAQALPTYAAMLAEIHVEYRRQLRHWYGTETRWPESEFWRRRQVGPDLSE
jgi:flavin-dependent dehydrogenase